MPYKVQAPAPDLCVPVTLTWNHLWLRRSLAGHLCAGSTTIIFEIMSLALSWTSAHTSSVRA